MKVQKGSVGVAPLVMTAGNRWRWGVNLTTGKFYPHPNPPVKKPRPIQEEGGWVQESFRKFWRKIFVPARTGTPNY